MTVQTFVAELDEIRNSILGRLASTELLTAESQGSLDIVTLLKIALKNEIEASELAARWMGTAPEVDFKLALARQCGDEAKHYRLIADRLKELGFDVESHNPLGQGYGPLFQYLLTLESTVERAAAGQFTREGIALVKNQQFIELCDAKQDKKTADLYREIIQPDEKYHHELGRKMLLKYATTPKLQEKARQAARKTLELAEELQKALCEKTGLHHAPGC